MLSAAALIVTILLAPPARGGSAEVSLNGIAGTYVTPDAGANGKGLVIVAGSGPTDRDGNNPFGVNANSLRQLSDVLVADGMSVLRYDKRGIAASKALVTDEAKLRFNDFVADAGRWADWTGGRPGIACVFMLGHSEGALIATMVARERELAGLVLVTAPGRPLGALLREQLSQNPRDAEARSRALSILDALTAGKTVGEVPHDLRSLFRPSVQPYLISVLDIDPAAALAALDVPALIVSGGRDLQVGLADFDTLKTARPEAEAIRIPAMNHMLKDVGPGREQNLAAYGDPDLPLSPRLAATVKGFVARTPCPA